MQVEVLDGRRLHDKTQSRIAYCVAAMMIRFGNLINFRWILSG